MNKLKVLSFLQLLSLLVILNVEAASAGKRKRNADVFALVAKDKDNNDIIVTLTEAENEFKCNFCPKGKDKYTSYESAYQHLRIGHKLQEYEIQKIYKDDTTKSKQKKVQKPKKDIKKKVHFAKKLKSTLLIPYSSNDADDSSAFEGDSNPNLEPLTSSSLESSSSSSLPSSSSSSLSSIARTLSSISAPTSFDPTSFFTAAVIVEKLSPPPSSSSSIVLPESASIPSEKHTASSSSSEGKEKKEDEENHINPSLSSSLNSNSSLQLRSSLPSLFALIDSKKSKSSSSSSSSSSLTSILKQQRNQALIEAIKNGNNEYAKELLDLGADSNSRDEKEGYTALFYVNDKEMAELLIAKGADVNFATSDNRTPLMFYIFQFSPYLSEINKIKASKETIYSIIKLLIDKGANVNFGSNRNGLVSSPMKIALQALGHLEGYTPFSERPRSDHLSNLKYNEMIIKLLVAHGAIAPFAQYGNLDVGQVLRRFYFKKPN